MTEYSAEKARHQVALTKDIQEQIIQLRKALDKLAATEGDETLAGIYAHVADKLSDGVVSLSKAVEIIWGR